MFYDRESNPRPVPGEVPSSGCSMAIPYAELHCHSQFSLLDGASAPDELVERAVALGLEALAVTDHQGLYGAVRFSRRPRRRASGRSSASRSSCWTRPPRIPADRRPGPAVAPAAASGARRRHARGTRRQASRHDRVRVERSGRRVTGTPSRRTCAGSGRGSWGRTSCSSRETRPATAPLPARQRRAPGGDEGRAALHPRAARRAHRGARGAHGLPPWRARATAARGRPGGRAAASRKLAPAVRRSGWLGGRRPALSSSSSITCCPTTTGSSPRARGLAAEARAADRRHERRPLRPALGPRAPGRARLDPPRPVARRARRPATTERRVVPEVRRGRAGGLPPASRRRGRADARGLARGHRELGRAGALAARSISSSSATASPASRCRRGETPFSHLAQLCHGRRAGATTPSPRRVLKQMAHELDVIERTGLAEFFLICWDLMRFSRGARHPRAGSRQCGRFDRRLRARHHPRRPDPPRAALRALHQRGPHDLPGRRHRLRLVPPRGGHPVRLRALRRRAHRHGLQPRDVPGSLGRARGRLRARLPAPARRPRREGARDVRLGHGPARPRGGRRLRRVLRRARGRGPGRRAVSRRAPPARRHGRAQPRPPSRPAGAACARKLSAARRTCGPVRPTTRAGRATRPRARSSCATSPGAPGASMAALGRRSKPVTALATSGPLGCATPIDGASPRSSANSLGRCDRARGIPTRRWPASSLRRGSTDLVPSGSRPGTAGSSSAPASTASRATSRSTSGACS